VEESHAPKYRPRIFEGLGYLGSRGDVPPEHPFVSGVDATPWSGRAFSLLFDLDVVTDAPGTGFRTYYVEAVTPERIAESQIPMCGRGLIVVPRGTSTTYIDSSSQWWGVVAPTLQPTFTGACSLTSELPKQILS
jgi:hypothetical protein